MPIQQFRTYDIIVDITPGALAILLLATLILPRSYTTTLAGADGILASVILLLAGFISGRLLHALSGGITRFLAKRGHVESDDDSLIDLIENGQDLASQSDENDDETDLEDDSSEADDIDYKPPEDIDRNVLTKAIESLQERMTGQESDPDENSDSNENSDPTPESIRRYGESLLYDKTTLHHRYEILTTFYRSLAVLLAAFFPFYLIYSIYLLYNILVTESTVQPLLPISAYILTTILLPILAYTAYHRYSKFTDRRNHGFVNDTHRHFTD